MVFDNTGGKFDWLNQVAISTNNGNVISLLDESIQLLIRIMSQTREDGKITIDTLQSTYKFLTSEQYHDYILNSKLDIPVFSNRGT